MEKAYRVIAYLIALEVMVQATMIAWAVFGLHNWIVNDGGVADKELLDCRDCGWSFTAERGFMIHGINGQMIIPLLALVLLVVAFLAKIPGGVTWAVLVVVLVALQAFVLAELGTESAFVGALHGLNAIVLFGAAMFAGMRVSRAVGAVHA
jgi:hypothetical protein